MAARRRPVRTRLRSAADSVLLHDMRNMGQRLHLLLSNLDDHYGDPEFKRGVLDLLRSTTEKLDAMATQWEARSGGVLIKVSLDVNDLLRDRFRGAGAVRVETDFGSPPRVWGDPYLLSEAIENIVENAVEAASSAVRIGTGLEARSRRRWALLEIVDDGPGMPEGFLSGCLDRPFQTTKPDGVGLGLYSAGQIVGLHRGKIEIRSAPGVGTTVRILLPASKGEV